MKKNKRFLIIGEVYTDVHMDMKDQQLRLGGIFHSARACSSFDVSYALAFIAPNYLLKSINEWGERLDSEKNYNVGNIDGCPNIITINNSSEIDYQGYNDLLRDQCTTLLNPAELEKALFDFEPTDVVIYPGKYSLTKFVPVLRDFKGNIHIDVQYESESLDEILNSGLKIETLIFSTSSNIFGKSSYSFDSIISNYPCITEGFLLKENRGGSRYFEIQKQRTLTIPAFKTSTVHSVGVGDCFNIVFLYLKSSLGVKSSLKKASYVSMLYASTMDHSLFTSLISRLDSKEINELPAKYLSWEKRREHHIYLAAPDFPHINTTWIDRIYDCLKYHNFLPHRPVRENGLITGAESEFIQQAAYEKDIDLIERSSLLIAIILNDDPGTYVEIGWASKAGKPVILFDPYNQVNNLFLKKTATFVFNTLEGVIDATFDLLGELDIEQQSSSVGDALLLASGGLDSTVMAYKLLLEGKQVVPVIFDYGQHCFSTEYETLINVLPVEFRAKVKIVNIKDIYQDSTSRMIIEPNLWKDVIHADDLYLPYRNLLFLSIGASIAQSLEIKEVYSAFINSNRALEIDCSQDFFNKLGELLEGYGPIDIKMPFRDFSKLDVMKLGIELGVPFPSTYSCQARSSVPCGACPNCVDRLEAFEQLHRELK